MTNVILLLYIGTQVSHLRVAASETLAYQMSSAKVGIFRVTYKKKKRKFGASKKKKYICTVKV